MKIRPFLVALLALFFIVTSARALDGDRQSELHTLAPGAGLRSVGR